MINTELTTGEIISISIFLIGAFMGVVAWFFAKFIGDTRTDAIHDVEITNMKQKMAEIEQKMDKQYQELNTTISKNYNSLTQAISKNQLDVTNSLGEIKVLIEKKLK